MKLLRAALAIAVLFLAVGSNASAQGVCITGGTGCGPTDTTSAPEIDPSMASSGAILLGGAILLLRGRRSR